MTHDDTFDLTETHIKLLRAAHVDWNGGEFGAPCIDPKRPYGSSDGVRDVARAMGWPIPPIDPPREPYEKWLRGIHRETATALQIVLCTGSFTPGTYRRRVEWDARSWELVPAAREVREHYEIICGGNVVGCTWGDDGKASVLAEEPRASFRLVEPSACMSCAAG